MVASQASLNFAHPFDIQQAKDSNCREPEWKGRDATPIVKKGRASETADDRIASEETKGSNEIFAHSRHIRGRAQPDPRPTTLLITASESDSRKSCAT